MKMKLLWLRKPRNHSGIISRLLVCMRAIRTKLGNELHWGSGDSLPLSHDHLGSRIGTRLTCDYSALHAHHVDDSLNVLQDKGWGWDKESAASSFLPFSEPHWERERDQQWGGWGGRWRKEGVISFLFKRFKVRSAMIPPGPLTRQPCLSSIKANGCN